MNLANELQTLGKKARSAARVLATLSTDQKNAILLSMAEALESQSESILAANAIDMEAGKKRGLSTTMLDRLRLDEKRLHNMAQDIRNVANLHDPVGEILREWDTPHPLHIIKIRVPIGVVGIIYESRPNVTSDAAVLCLKTGNAVILRGGSESFHSNTAIANALQSGGEQAGLPVGSVQLVPSTDREAVKLMVALDKYIDVIVPRGGHALIEAVVSNARIPVIKHYDGICHVFVDKSAEMDMATALTVNSKCQRAGVCNAAETLLVHADIAEKFLPIVAEQLKKSGTILRGDEEACRILGGDIPLATEEDWRTEYLDLILSIRVVKNLDAAIEHIETYGSHHSDAIVTDDPQTAEKFLNEVDSATVYWNASTRFTDGAEFGFGAEIGISTDKLHARGPMGLEELTTYKYQIKGTGQLRS